MATNQYFIDNPGSNVSTLTGLAANDQTSYLGGVYFESDWCSGDGMYSWGGTSGVPGLGLLTTGGSSVVIPGALAASDIDQHPGVAYINTAALNDNGVIVSGTNNGSLGAYLGVFPNSPKMTWRQTFLTPKNLSNATDRYVIYLGPFNSNNGTGTLDGWAITYTDNVGSGNWQLIEKVAGVSLATLSTAAVGPSAKTWYTAIWTVLNKQITVTLQAAGGAVTTLFSAVTSAQLNAGNPVPASLGAIAMNRTAFASGNLALLLDYSSYICAPPNRS